MPKGNTKPGQGGKHNTENEGEKQSQTDCCSAVGKHSKQLTSTRKKRVINSWSTGVWISSLPASFPSAHEGGGVKEGSARSDIIGELLLDSMHSFY